MLNYDPTVTLECKVCGHEIEVNRARITATRNRVRCKHCNSRFEVDADAEFVGGVWYDKTKLVRV